jgi:hypothetical protein
MGRGRGSEDGEVKGLEYGNGNRNENGNKVSNNF